MNLFSKSNLFTIVILIITSIFTIVWINANAEINLPLSPITNNLSSQFRSDIVGITLSKTCISLVKLNSTLCPSYDNLIQLGYDQSTDKSGKFVYKNGLLQREYTKVRNEIIYYLNLQNVTVVDPSSSLSQKIKTIIIEPSIKSYLIASDMSKYNNTRTVHKDRYVNPQCSIGTISSANWLITLPDTIRYLRNNCSGELAQTLTTINDNSTATDIKTSQKYKEDKFKNEAKNKYKTVSHVGTNDNSTNKSVTEDKAPKYVPPVKPPFDYSKYR